MGSSKQIYFTEENIGHLKRLPKGKMSSLINDLLNEYFKKTALETMTEEELRKFVEIKKLEEEFEKKRVEIENGR